MRIGVSAAVVVAGLAAALAVVDGAVVMTQDNCMLCSHCYAVCPANAVQVPWGAGTTAKLQEKIAEYTLAAGKGRKWQYVSFLTSITYNCDCVEGAQTPFMPDLGILYSTDPVAIDQAALDLVKKANGGTDPFEKKTGINNQHMTDYAEQIELGTKKYELYRL